MNTLTSKRIPLQGRIVAQAFALTAIVAVINPLVFRYYGLHLPPWLWAIGALFNFVLFVDWLSFRRWLRRKQDDWDPTTRRRFDAFVLLIGIALVLAAIFVTWPR
jgi:hypothetical protein